MLLVFCLLLSCVIILLGCGDSDYEVRSYHKVYKDGEGNWQGKNVSYLAEKNFGPVLIVAVIAVGYFILNKNGKKLEIIYNDEKYTLPSPGGSFVSSCRDNPHRSKLPIACSDFFMLCIKSLSPA